ncbi:MAG: GNAT family N-acetyltransferase [Eubacteriales bacterium]
MLEKIILYVQHLRNPESILHRQQNHQEEWLIEVICLREQLYTIPTCKNKLLLIVDDASTAKELIEEGYYVIGYCHRDNSSQEFTIRYLIEEIEEVEYTYFEEVYNAYHGVSRIVITTSRCILREITLEDVPKLYEIYCEKEVTQYVEPLYENMEEEMEYTKKYIENMYGFYGYGIWIVEEKGTGCVIGRAGLEANGQQGEVDMGFLLLQEKQRIGIGYELCCAMIAFAKKMKLCHKINCLVQSGNIPSINLCKKVGFIDQGVIQQSNKYYKKFQLDLS